MSAVAAMMAPRLFNTPLALLPRQAELLGTLARGGLVPVAALAQSTPDQRPQGYQVVDGVAIIRVTGCLVNRDWGWYDETSYGLIRAALRAALDDTAVRAIVLHIDSPGGEVAGCGDLSDAIYAARGIKPIWAIVDESAYSAAYWLASACDRIVVPATGGTGSIGVITMHCDITGMLDKAGLVVTTIQFGSRKSDSYPTTKLSEEAQARFQADIDTLGEMFVAAVARNRGLKPASVRDTQAGTFLGAAGIPAGLVDEVASPAAAFQALLAQLG